MSVGLSFLRGGEVLVSVFFTAVPPESLSGLKPSTLKQLGQAVAPTAVKQVYTQTHTGRCQQEIIHADSSGVLTLCLTPHRILLTPERTPLLP